MRPLCLVVGSLTEPSPPLVGGRDLRALRHLLSLIGGVLGDRRVPRLLLEIVIGSLACGRGWLPGGAFSAPRSWLLLEFGVSGGALTVTRYLLALDGGG
jgi:hypothetical protein